ncbi:MAG TPA: LptF/LptG family permease, partial [Spirochaetia bacterium]|nr:LptF/LptG family permease [Spirochaetia bacterium]
MKSQYGKVYLYISREIFASFIIAFLFFFFIFFVNQLLLMAERILSKRVPLGDVLLLILYSIPIIVTYALPFGTLVGALMAIGRLSSENEILALRALGVSI